MKQFLLSAVCVAMCSTGFAQTQKIVKEQCVRPGTREVSDGAEQHGTRQFQPWAPIKNEDIIYKKRVYRQIDLRSGNELLSSRALGASLAEVLVDGAAKGEYMLYTGDNSRFLKVLDKEQVNALKLSKDLSMVTGYRIKEDWLQLQGYDKRFVRMIGIAPEIAGRDEVLFWVYYPEAREHLFNQKISDPNGVLADLDEVFEGRFFESTVIPREQWDKPAATVK